LPKKNKNRPSKRQGSHLPLCEISVRSHLGITEGSLDATGATFKIYKKEPCLDDFTSLQKLAVCMELRDTMISYAMNLIERRQKP
jgi:uncharacterized protein YigE (DUF2233 family)